MTSAQTDSAITHRCPLCDAGPGQPCHTVSGRPRAYLHLVRSEIEDAWLRNRRKNRRETPPNQALCCQCGQIRTYKKAPRYISEQMDTQTWHRMTGSLKCSECGTVTRHALLRSDESRDFAENYQRVALGGVKSRDVVYDVVV